MSLSMLSEMLVSVGDHYSMDTSDLRALCLKSVVLSLKYVDRRALWEALFGTDYVDWDLADQLHPDKNVLGDPSLWMALFDLCSWADLENDHPDPPLNNMRRAVRKCGLDSGGWGTTCQLLIVHLLRGMPSLHAFQMITHKSFKRDTQQPCALLLATLSDSPQTPQAYEASLAVVLGTALRLDVATIATHLRTSQARRDDHSNAMKMKEMGSYHGRPRLRDRVDTSEEHKLRLDTRLGTWESYQGWCQLHQFPNVLSESVKDRLYFLASQTTWDWRRHVSRVLSHHGDLAEKITQYPVTRPDLRVLSRCIETLSMNGTPPFPEMTAFKVKCFRSFPVSHVQRMNLTQILRLYACIYQNHAHWKELWKQQLSLLSPQIIKDCETFAATVPFAEDAVMALLCKTSPHH